MDSIDLGPTKQKNSPLQSTRAAPSDRLGQRALFRCCNWLSGATPGLRAGEGGAGSEGRGRQGSMHSARERVRGRGDMLAFFRLSAVKSRVRRRSAQKLWQLDEVGGEGRIIGQQVWR